MVRRYASAPMTICQEQTKVWADVLLLRTSHWLLHLRQSLARRATLKLKPSRYTLSLVLCNLRQTPMLSRLDRCLSSSHARRSTKLTIGWRITKRKLLVWFFRVPKAELEVREWVRMSTIITSQKMALGVSWQLLIPMKQIGTLSPYGVRCTPLEKSMGWKMYIQFISISLARIISLYSLSLNGKDVLWFLPLRTTKLFGTGPFGSLRRWKMVVTAILGTMMIIGHKVRPIWIVTSGGIVWLQMETDQLFTTTSMSMIWQVSTIVMVRLYHTTPMMKIRDHKKNR